ncbi:hypothetical protein ACJ73_07773 [Blastomyces percursus]|uniref:Uncharacterized protein n=1 Tax=Blastomyces percursus TaxID=1658174 RepID=A0A1J9QKZ1_9EURO|nr:hypothetical protein ACJ73_07773 [Blastomyces percursus]
MNSFLDHGFVSPHPSFASPPNPYDHCSPSSGNIPTPISLSDSTFLEPRLSPSQSHYSWDFYYYIPDAGTHHGLGITHTNSAYIQSGAFAFDSSPNRPWTSPAIPTPHSAQQRTFPNIAPDPEGLQNERRISHSTEAARRRSGSSRPSSNSKSKTSQMDKENDYILWLKDQCNLPWKTIVERTNNEFGTNHKASRLQMRMTRLKQRQHEIIARKMQEFGGLRWPASQCELKWQELKQT